MLPDSTLISGSEVDETERIRSELSVSYSNGEPSKGCGKGKGSNSWFHFHTGHLPGEAVANSEKSRPGQTSPARI